MKLDWRAVEEADYKEYIKNLRSIQCPEETIRDIIIADVNKLYASKFKSARPAQPAKERKYWEADTVSYQYRSRSPEQREEEKLRRDLEKEKRELLEELLGIDYSAELAKSNMWNANTMDQQLSFLSEEKRQAIKDVQKKWQKEMQAFYETTEPGEPWTPEQQKKQKELMKRQEAEIAQLLSPQEKEEYDLRVSNTSAGVRNDLAAFEPSEAEFKRMFQLRKAFDEKFTDYVSDPDDEEGQKKWSQAYSALQKEFTDGLDPARKAEFELARSYGYRELVGLTKAFDVPRKSAKKVYEMKSTVEKEAMRLRNDRTLTDEQRKTALKAIRVETEKALTEALGDKALRSYKSNQDYWIRNLGR